MDAGSVDLIRGSMEGAGREDDAWLQMVYDSATGSQSGR
jgi:hypothetical protein